MDQTIKIAIGDLRHSTAGRHSAFMPVGIGYIASYTLSRLGADAVSFRFYNDPNDLLDELKDWHPHVIALSCYCWNSSLSSLVFRHAKKYDPTIICIGGGPNIPLLALDCEKYLKSRREIDFFVYREGEIPFYHVVKKISDGIERQSLKEEILEGVMFIDPDTQKIKIGPPVPKINDLDIIPSPYLSGLMDQWFDGNHSPAIETARGCPFSCAYCWASNSWYSSMSFFSVERIKNELTYIAEKISKYRNVILSICDSNFGTYSRDEEIAYHLKYLQETYDWPNAFDVTTGKTNYNRILKIASMLDNKIQLTTAMQTINHESLIAIKRKNISLDLYQEVNNKRKQQGTVSYTELIIPLPEESMMSFFNGVRKCIELGADSVYVYTTMLLMQTPLYSMEYRLRYSMLTRFRMLPRQFGEYNGEKCFEIEEVCIATNTMPFEDYIECRGFALIMSIYFSQTYDFVKKNCEELNICYFDIVKEVWLRNKQGRYSNLSMYYNQYINETREELFESEEHIFASFSLMNNYNKLLSGVIGDNLIRKYTFKILINSFSDTINIIYEEIIKACQDTISEEIISSIEDVIKWSIVQRDFCEIKEGNVPKEEVKLTLDYDVNDWYLSKYKYLLLHYKRPVTYILSYDTNAIEEIFRSADNLYGHDKEYQISKLLVNYDVKTFWKKLCYYSKKKL